MNENGTRIAASVRAKLNGTSGRVFWRSLDELAQSDEFHAYLENEFPSLARAPASTSSLDRRALLKGMAASVVLAGLTGCKWDSDEKALPYVKTPEFVVPGNAKYYASAVTLGGYAMPLLGKTESGRPIKLEGNPDHPATQGASDPFLQAALLGLYDPDRSQAPLYRGKPSSWQAADDALSQERTAMDANQGDGFRLLTGAVTSPTLLRQIADMTARWPKARWHVLEPINQDRRLQATQLVYGRSLDRHLQLDQAQIVISLDDDVLGPGPHQMVHAKAWSKQRQAFRSGHGECRLFVAEPALSLTGARSENRLIVAPARIGLLIRALAQALDIGTGSVDLSAREQQWLKAVLAALDGHHAQTLVTAGSHQAPEIQALALAINDRLGSRALRFSEPVIAAPPDGSQSIAVLTQDMAAGNVSTLLMVDVNPLYATAADLGLREAFEKVALRIHAGLHFDESAADSHWHLSLQHELETWSDARAIDGTVSIVQPLVRPFYSVRSQHEILARLLGGSDEARNIVQATWLESWGNDFAARWSDSLVRGFVADSAAQAVTTGPITATIDIKPQGNSSITALIQPDAALWDGRFANNAWLQELPRPLNKITWGNVASLSPQLAKTRGIKNGDELRIDAGGRSLVAPAWIMPGQHADTIVLTLGYGREHGGHIAQGVGYNAFAIQSAAEPWRLDDVKLTLTGNRQTIATTQLHQAMDGFDFVRSVATPDGDVKRAPAAKSFYPQRQWDSPSWGMSIDLDSCIGCNACVIACMAENNVPVVGKDLVAQGREMHWLRIDHYYEGDAADPKSHFQPVPCMHCEEAPCEMGCPVNATVHSKDGLNLQVYNRCIGTRTCSSYCPYKVRRFNWYDYTGDDPEAMRAMRNPDVTVRSRGVMEKCTYCVQRISAARIAAKIDNRPIRDGEVVTACQQACPTQAIVFGDIVDGTTAVAQQKASRRSYTLLEEANTRPRTTYLAKVEAKRDGEGGGEGGSG